MSLPWFKTDSILPESEELLRLEECLDEPLAIAYVTKVQAYSARHEKFVLSKKLVERVAGWRGEPGKLVEALIEAGFLDPCLDDVMVVGMEEQIAQYQSKREGSRTRQKRFQERHRPDTTNAVSDGVTDDVANAVINGTR
jgi:hypothetical protein